MSTETRYKYIELEWNEIDVMKIFIDAKVSRISKDKKTFNECKVLYKISDNDIKILSMNYPKVRGRGISKLDDYLPSVSIIFDNTNQEHVDFIIFLTELFKRIIIQYYRACEPKKIEKLKKTDEQLQEVSLSDLRDTYSLDKFEKDLVTPPKDPNDPKAKGVKDNYSMYLKLNTKGYNDQYSTVFIGIDGKPIDPRDLEQHEFDFIPLQRLERIYIANATSFQTRFTNAVVHKIYQKEHKLKQQKVLESINEDDIREYIESKRMLKKDDNKTARFTEEELE
jgi:hypothetical protein